MKHILIISLIMLTSALQGAVKETEVPYWALAGILAQETRSFYRTTSGTEEIVYVDRATGHDGELSAFQITAVAWRQVRRPGDRFQDLATDQFYAERVAMDYLLWLYNGSARRSWPHAVQMYNRGPGRLRYSYYANVALKAARAGYPGGTRH